MATATNPPAPIQPALWLLISPALPVGGYSYSQGLEYAVEAEWIRSANDVRDWLQGIAAATLVHQDLAYLKRLHAATQCSDHATVKHCNQALTASRESAELLDEDRQMGAALARLIRDVLSADAAATLPEKPLFATAFAAAAVAEGIDCRSVLAAYAWVWHENQVAAAIKLVPLGQTDGQRLMLEAGRRLDAYVDAAEAVEDSRLGLTLPGVALASARHEHQRTRLFRS
ncbi:MAG: urease accessory UreF family protein [Pseudomonadota bacterium]